MTRIGMQRTSLMQGFTLLEVLVAVSLFAVITTALYASVQLGMQAWNGVRQRGDSAEDVRLLQHFMYEYVGAAVPVLSVEGGVARSYFRGRADEIRFAADIPARVGSGGLYGMRLRVREEQGRRMLVMERILLHPDLAADAGPGTRDDSVLLEDPVSVVFAYYDASGASGRGAWHESWEDRKSLPDIVRLRVTDAGRRAWPEMLVRLRVDAPRTVVLPGLSPKSPPQDRPGLAMRGGPGKKIE